MTLHLSSLYWATLYKYVDHLSIIILLNGIIAIYLNIEEYFLIEQHLVLPPCEQFVSSESTIKIPESLQQSMLGR